MTVKAYLLRALVVAWLAAWLAHPPLFAQELIIASKGRTDSGSGITGCPPAANLVHHTVISSGTQTWEGATSGTGTLAGQTARVEDPASSGNYALDFDGTDDQATFGSDADTLAETAISVMAWVRQDAYGAATMVIMGKTASGASDWSWRLQTTIDTPGAVRVQLENTSNGLATWTSPDDSWDSHVGLSTYTHVGFSATGCGDMSCDTIQIYIDGQPVTTTLVSSAGGTMRSDGAYLVALASTNLANEFAGLIDDTRIYNVVVAASCFAEIFGAGRG